MANSEGIGRPEGGNYLEKAKIDASKSKNIDLEFVPSQINIKPMPRDKRTFRCCMCGKEYATQSGNFATGGKSPLWKGNNGFLPFCKSCCETLMCDLTSFYKGNEEHAMKHLCCLFDWYYDVSASAMTLTRAKSAGNRITLYPSKFNTRQVSTRGETFLDTVKDDFIASQKVIDADVSDIEEEPEDDFVVTKEMLRTWGGGFTKDQYRYLEQEYKDWTTKNICNTKSQEEIYRNIALAQLDIRIARQTGGKVAEAQKALQGLMNSANILPRQTTENVLADTQTFSTLIKKYEETDPIPEPEPRWRDVDGIRKYINTWFKGGLAKALKIPNNDNAALYDEAVKEFEKYTVEKTTAQSDGSAQNDGSMFDSIQEKPSEATQ